MDWRSYYWRWLKTAWLHSLSGADLASGVLSAGLGVVAHFWPSVSAPMAAMLWQLPVWALAGVAAARLILAPFWMARKDAAIRIAKPEEVSAALGAIQRYETNLEAANQKLAVISAIIAHTEHWRAASNSSSARTGADNSEEANEISSLSASLIASVAPPPELTHRRELRLQIGWNKYLVLLATPMLRPAEVTIEPLEGVQHEVSNVTRISFVAEFFPHHIRVPLHLFNFTAQAKPWN